MSAPVTLPRIRYSRVYVCLGCDLLATSERAHALTCSPACRVRLHRNPARLKRLEMICAAQDVSVPLVLDCRAVERLRPDLIDGIRDGKAEAKSGVMPQLRAGANKSGKPLQRVPCGGKRRRDGQPCEALSVPGKRRCRWHGGCSTGPKTAEGKARALANLRQNRRN